MTYYYNSECENIHIMLGNQLDTLLRSDNAYERDIVIMCIGSDRSTGDSLGPIVGYRLRSGTDTLSKSTGFSFVGQPSSDSADKSSYTSDNVNAYIYGDIFNPINASNLECSISCIHELHDNPYIIAIDACLGKPSHIGFVTLSTGPLHPGSGTKNELPEVGNLHITGIVNTIHHGRHLLHSTRLSTVISLADVIEGGIRQTFSQSRPAQADSLP